MPGPFAITAATNTVLLDSSRQGQTSFTVSNVTTHRVRGRARVIPLSAAADPWLALQGEAERDFASSGTQQYAVHISVPPGAPASDYAFRLDMVDLANPDEDFSEGPSVSFVVAPSLPAKKPFPWWIVAVVVAALLILSSGAYGIGRLLQRAAVPTPTATPAPTPTATPVPVSWQRVAPLLSNRFGGAATTGRDGRIYVMGGINNAIFLNTIEIYDPTTNSWSRHTRMPTGRTELAAVSGPDGRIYAIGGRNRSGDSGLSQIDEVDAYNPRTDSWAVVAHMIIPRHTLAAVLGPDGRIYAIGGFAFTSALNTVEAYNPDTNSWTMVAPMHTARVGAAAVLGPDGRIYVIGGSNGNNFVNITEAYDVKTNTWAVLAPIPTLRNGLAAALGADGRIYALGGFNGQQRLDTVEVYDPKANTWMKGVPMPTNRTLLTAAVGLDGRIYAIGGFSDHGGLNVVEVYDTKARGKQVPALSSHVQIAISPLAHQRARKLVIESTSRKDRVQLDPASDLGERQYT